MTVEVLGVIRAARDIARRERRPTAVHIHIFEDGRIESASVVDEEHLCSHCEEEVAGEEARAGIPG